ncbi:hypothetical protein IFM89_027762 [Coptis chinensis]|uniref:DUF4283 domain-containing protein n=1 Tax=Coptis chinensis TaxID=261450 RepID=A0A835LZX7_9MAGN|nr:hypothetical protein IFM89_027762 [Coptis chinensis]
MFHYKAMVYQLPTSTSHSLDVALKQFDLQILEGVAQIPMDIIHKGFSDWQEYVVRFFLEHRLPYKMVKEFLKKKLRTKTEFEMVSDTDLYYFKFQNEKDRCLVLEAGPVLIGGRCFVVIEWPSEIEKKKKTVKAIPIWVNLHEVSKDLWTGEGLGFLASRIVSCNTTQVIMPECSDANLVESAMDIVGEVVSTKLALRHEERLQGDILARVLEVRSPLMPYSLEQESTIIPYVETLDSTAGSELQYNEDYNAFSILTMDEYNSFGTS